jgi:hypothetical protein
LDAFNYILIRSFRVRKFLAYDFEHPILIKHAEWLLHVFEDTDKVCANDTSISDVHKVLIVPKCDILLQVVYFLHL